MSLSVLRSDLTRSPELESTSTGRFLRGHANGDRPVHSRDLVVGTEEENRLTRTPGPLNS